MFHVEQRGRKPWAVGSDPLLFLYSRRATGKF